MQERPPIPSAMPELFDEWSASGRTRTGSSNLDSSCPNPTKAKLNWSAQKEVASSTASARSKPSQATTSPQTANEPIASRFTRQGPTSERPTVTNAGQGASASWSLSASLGSRKARSLRATNQDDPPNRISNGLGTVPVHLSSSGISSMSSG